MTPKKPTAAPDSGDRDAASAAVYAYFDEVVADAKAAMDKAALQLAGATSRLHQWGEGDRLTREEAMLVHAAAVTRATELARQLLKGEPGGATREQYDHAKAAADATRRGLLADGYDLPDTSGGPARR